jgi:hypothetical protein
MSNREKAEIKSSKKLNKQFAVDYKWLKCISRFERKKIKRIKSRKMRIKTPGKFRNLNERVVMMIILTCLIKHELLNNLNAKNYLFVLSFIKKHSKEKLRIIVNLMSSIFDCVIDKIEARKFSQ